MFNLSCYIKSLKPQFQNPKSKLIPFSNPLIQLILNETKELQSSRAPFSSPAYTEENLHRQEKNGVISSTPILHPWPEWVILVEKLFKNGYFEAIENPFSNGGEFGHKQANLMRTACLNFARDRYQLIRNMSREDIVVISGCGCPSTDRKVVNSAKRLRAHVGINEGNVCRSCILRGDCDRAYVQAREDEGGQTVDVMRLLLTYSLDPLINCVDNKPCLNKNVKESVRKLLKEMVDSETSVGEHVTSNSMSIENDIGRERSQNKASMKQGDWICTKCDFHNFSRNIKCLRCEFIPEERKRKTLEEMDHLPLKKGDWMCDKCNFLNFARNRKCMQCKENPPKRQLNPGEWECESCNYVNFRRNMICLKCDHKRPIASKSTNIASQSTGNNEKNHQSLSWFGQHNQTWDDDSDKSLKFVESDDQDWRTSSPRNQVPSFVDFPILGGKSEISRGSKKQEYWNREDTHKYDSFKFDEKIEDLSSGSDEDDDIDDMAEWFGARKKNGKEHHISRP